MICICCVRNSVVPGLDAFFNTVENLGSRDTPHSKYPHDHLRPVRLLLFLLLPSLALLVPDSA